MGVLGFVFGPDRAQRELVQLLSSIYPSATAQEVRIARELVDGRAVSLGIGLIGTVLGAAAIHGSIDTVIAVVMPGGRKRSVVRGQLEALAFIGGIALLALLSFALSFGAQVAESVLAEAGLGRPSRTAIAFVAPLLGLVAGYLFFAAIFRFVPRSPVPARTASTAALVSAVLWELAKIAFAFFTRGLGAFTAYGPIAFAAGLLTWVYLTAVIILVGAEVMKVRTKSWKQAERSAKS